ncbi:zinc ribbon domain-containing protein [Vibrio aestuarianus]|uniref:zinc ribbon domain-containing protein n=1 Tax=Vibrio aestuarianus TaxID=28171 RepID=UPI001C3C733E|nr:zinc ribbon domain-containing protein [Vibrio aestuarianus]
MSTDQIGACSGHISQDNRKTQAHFECVGCGYTNNADIVGALNILERGHRLLACEVSGAIMPPATGTCR